MTKVLICPDSFKGSISAPDAAAALASGIHAARPAVETVLLPVADGGEGTLDALCAPAARICVPVTNPFGHPISAEIGLLSGGETAVIEMAQAAGLTLIAESERDPLRASTRGVGEMILAALDRGCRSLLITVGGSGTNDGGIGMMAALGLRLLDANGAVLSPLAGALTRAAALDCTALDPRLAECRITIATDVTNPLCGERGATAIYGPQKGAGAEALVQLEAGLRTLGALVDAAAGRAVSEAPGCGAGGGLALGLLAFTPARICSGIDAVLDALTFDQALDGAAFVIAGEGRTDRQSACGKAIAGIARRAQKKGVPVYVLSGSLSCDGDALDALEAAGVRGVMSILDSPCTLSEAMADAGENLHRAAERLARMLLPEDVCTVRLRHAARRLEVSDAACIIAPPGDTVRMLTGSGIAPLVRALRADGACFRDNTVADKILGLAAAMLFVHGNAAAVYGEVMSESADRFLTAEGIPHAAGKLVPHIVNRTGDGVCPMEARAEACTSTQQAWEIFDSIVD